MRALCLGLTVSILLPAGQLLGQADSARAQVRPPAMVTGGDVLKLGIAGALAGVAYSVDGTARASVRGPEPQGSQSLRVLSDVGNAYGGAGAVVAGAALWGGGLVTKNETVAATGLRALEAITVSSVITKVVKGAAGRARPRVAPNSRNDFEFGRGFGAVDGDHESLPSGHATAAFAFAAAVTGEVARRAPEHRRAVAITTYGLGVVTAYARMHSDAHWLSDVTLGAGIGMVSGWAVTRWHATRPDNAIDRWLLRAQVSPGVDGAMRLGLVITPR